MNEKKSTKPGPFGPEAENHPHLGALCQPYTAEQITTRSENGRTESWVEQHHLLDRLNGLGISYSWKARPARLRARAPNPAPGYR